MVRAVRKLLKYFLIMAYVFLPAPYNQSTKAAQIAQGLCGGAAFDNCVDMGNSQDESFHSLIGWDGVEVNGPVRPPNGDISKRFQSVRKDNSVTLNIAQAAAPHLLYVEVEDGFRDDSWELHVNGFGPVYSYKAGPTYNVVFSHVAVVPAAYLPTTSPVITFKNKAQDCCGNAAVFSIQLTPIVSTIYLPLTIR